MAIRNFYSKQYWEIKVQKWFASGKSAKAWCRENQIVYTTFIKWRNLSNYRDNPTTNRSSQSSLNHSSEKVHFIELKNQIKPCSGIFLECEGVQIYISTDFDSTLLKKCVDALRGQAC